MTDYNKLIKQLNDEYKACANSVSAIGHRFAMVQLLFEFEAVINELNSLAQTVEESIVLYDIDSLGKWIKDEEWPMLDYMTTLKDDRNRDTIFVHTADFIKAQDVTDSFNLRNDKSGREKLQQEQCAEDGEVNRLIGLFKDNGNRFDDILYRNEKRIEDSVRHAIKELFVAINKVLTAADTGKSEDEYERYYKEKKTNPILWSLYVKNLNRWKSDLNDRISIDDIKYKLQTEIIKLNNLGCLLDDSNHIRPELVKNCKKKLQALCKDAVISDEMARGLAVLMERAELKDNCITINEKKIGKYIYEYRTKLNESHISALVEFDWLSSDLRDLYKRRHTGNDEPELEGNPANLDDVQKIVTYFNGDSTHAQAYLEEISGKTTALITEITNRFIKEGKLLDSYAHQPLYNFLKSTGRYDKSVTNWNKRVEAHNPKI